MSNSSSLGPLKNKETVMILMDISNNSQQQAKLFFHRVFVTAVYENSGTFYFIKLPRKPPLQTLNLTLSLT